MTMLCRVALIVRTFTRSQGKSTLLPSMLRQSITGQPGWMRASIRLRNEYLVVLGLAEVASTWQRVSSLRLWLLASNSER